MNPDDGPVARLAHRLQTLRIGSGLTYAEMAKRCNFSTTTLSQAAKGKALPTLDVTLAYARVCGGDLDEFRDLWQSVSGQVRTIRRPSEPTTLPRVPYRGLAPFRGQDADLFFGRGTEVAELVERVTLQACVAVIGPSGCGKSSLLNAGLVPALRAEPFPLSANVIVASFTPGERPLVSLTTCLADVLAVPSAELERCLDDGTTGLAEFSAMARRSHAGSSCLLLLVDQLEEVFTLCADPKERRQFIELMTSYRCSDIPGAVRVVMAVRADFIGACMDHPELMEMLRQPVPVGAMSAPQLRAAVTGPAQRCQCTVDDDLVQTVVADMVHGGGAGALPLMSHVLLETWHYRRDQRLTLADYQSAGGLEGAVAQTADQVYSGLNTAERRIARRMLLRLTAPGDDERVDVRRRVAREDLLPTAVDDLAASVLERLVDARLLCIDRGMVEVAHEALIRHWPTLQRWLHDDRDGVRLVRALTSAARQWEQAERNSDLLWRGGQVDRLSRWALDNGQHLPAVEQAFLDACVRMGRDELAKAKRVSRRLTVMAAGLVVLLAATAVGAQLAVHQSQAAQRQRDIAAAGRLGALSKVWAETHPLSLLLAVESLRLVPTDEARSALLSGLLHPRSNTMALTGHTATVYGVAFMGNGTRLVSAGEDRTIRIWNADTGTQIGHSLTGHTDPVADVAVSSDDRMIVSVSDDDTVRRWDPVTGKQIDSPMTHSDNAKAVAIGRDGKLIVTAGKDGTVRRWDAATGALIDHPIQTNGDVLWSLALSPDAKTIAAAGDGQVIHQWETDTGMQVRQPLQGHTKPIHALAFSPDGSMIVSAAADGTVRRWDSETGDLIGDPLTGHTDVVEAVTVSSNNTLIISAGRDRTIRLWNAATGRPAGPPLTGHTDQIKAVAINSRGTKIASASRDRTVRIWDLHPGTPIGPSLPKHDQVARMTLNPDRTVIASTGQDRQVRLWDIATGEPIGDPLTGHEDEIRAIVYSPDGKMIASAAEDKTVRRWDAATGQPIGEPMQGHDAEVYTLAFSPDNRQIASGSFDGTVRRWDTATGSPIGPAIALHGSADASDIAYTPDGTMLIAAGGHVWQRWDPATGRPIGTPITSQHGHIEAVAVSPDSATLATVGKDGTIRRWKTHTGTPIGEPLTGHTSRTTQVEFDPDGAIIISADEQGTIRRWNASSGKPEGQPLTGYLDHVGRIKLSPGGTHIAAARPDGSLSIFPSTLERWIRHACHIVGRNLTQSEWNSFITDRPHTRTCPNYPPP